MPTKITKARQKTLNERVKALPKDYQIMFYEISKYLWQFASSEADVPNMQMDILDMFATRAQEGKDVFEIVGNDVIGFCDGILGVIPEQTWIGKMKADMNKSILKKLGKRKDNEK